MNNRWHKLYALNKIKKNKTTTTKYGNNLKILKSDEQHQIINIQTSKWSYPFSQHQHNHHHHQQEQEQQKQKQKQ